MKMKRNVVIKFFSEEERLRFAVHEKVRTVHEFLEKNYKQRPHLDMLAQMVDMSPEELLKEFQESYYETPAELIDAYRIQDSEATLVRTSMRIEKIAERFGFSSVEVYRKAFQKEFEATPEEHRERYRYDPSWKSYLQHNKEYLKRKRY